MSKKVILKRVIRANGGLCAIGSVVVLPDKVADRMKKVGAAVDAPSKEKAPAPAPAPVVSKMTKAELVAACEEKGFELSGDETKKELVEILGE